MKKLLLMAAAGIIAASSVHAVDLETKNNDKKSKWLFMSEAVDKSEVAPLTGGVQLEATGGWSTYNLFTGKEFDVRFSHNGTGTVLAYEPVSGTLVVPDLGRETEGTAYVGSSIDLWATNLNNLIAAGTITSRDVLNTYFYRDSSYRQIGTTTGKTPFIMTNPSLAVVNPTGSTTEPGELAYMFYTDAYTIDRVSPDDPAPTITTEGGIINLHDPGQSIIFGDEFSELQIEGPELNNPAPIKKFDRATISSYQGDYGNGWEYGANLASLLEEPDGLDDDNNYGVIKLNLKDISFESNIPASWRTDNFRAANYQSRYIFVDRAKPGNGNTGTYWGGLSAFFSDDFNDRKLAMCWSDDGVSFSAWAKLPMSILNTYASSRPEFSSLNGYEVTNSLMNVGYSKYDFMALSDSEAALFIPIVYRPADNNVDNPWFFQLVQATYNRDTETWRIEKIADLGTTSRFFLNHESNFTEGSVPAGFPEWYYDTQDFSNSSVDVSINTNGDIAVKYVKVTDTIPLANPLEVFQSDNDGELFVPDDNLLDEIQIDEVFVSYKEAGSDLWKEYQITRDGDRVHQYTFIPDRFETINNIPILYMAKIDRDRYVDGAFKTRLQTLDVGAYTMYANGWTDARFGWMDLEMPVSVEEIEPSLDMNIIYVAPNPTSDYLAVSFSMGKKADVKLYLANAAGQKVIDIFSGETFGMNVKDGINVSSLPSGAYYLTLEANGQNVTKLVHITR